MTTKENGQRKPEERQEKTVKMPSKDEMTEKLRKAKLLGASSKIGERLFSTFIDLVAGRNEGASGLNLAWEVAKFDTSPGVSPLMAETLEMQYEAFVETVTPDPDVANRAKEVRREIREIQRQRMKQI